MPKKKKKNKLFITLIVLFGIYIALYSASMSGYYSYKEYDKMQLTKEAMEKFEKDIEEGKDITIEDYITAKKTYNNKISDLGIKTGEITEKIIVDGLGTVFKAISKLVTD